MDESLLEDIRNYLDITWSDNNTNRKIQGIVQRGIKYLNGVAGKELDYSVDDKPKELLLDYCRYVRSNALSEFQNNYLPELLTLQMREEVATHKAEITNTDV